MKYFEKTAVEYHDYQQRIADRLKNVPGMVVYHGLGSGKTLTSINAAERFDMPTTVVTPASLQENFKKEIKKSKSSKTKYNVESYNKYINNSIIRGGMLVLDEAHRAKNVDTKTFRRIRDKRPLYRKALLLTGTPIQNHPHEVAPLIDLAANRQVLPLDPKSFNDKYINRRKVTPGIFKRIFQGAQETVVTEPKNLDEFESKVKPFVDYHKNTDADYPKRINKNVEVTMDQDQVNLNDYYTKKLDRGARYLLKEHLPPNRQNVGKLNSFISATRQVSNTTNTFLGKDKPSPKIEHIFKAIQGAKRPSLVYSNYLDSGIIPLSKKLTEANISHGVFTGELNSKKKKSLVDGYNKGKLKALLISSAGGEGLDLKNTEAVHVMEPHWNEPKIEQVIGRAIRYKSHDTLPAADKNVTVYQYISKYPKEKPGFIGRLFGRKPSTDKVSADEYLTDMGTRKTQLNNAFLDRLKTNRSKYDT